MDLKPWREVIVPHEDVLQGSFQESEFAADLTKVAKGIAAPEYQDPVRFFERTVITEGMGLLLQSVLKRLSGQGGDPVVQLQTAFGGGKTHTLMAVYHLARGETPASALMGIPTLLDRSGVAALPQGRVAILDGNALAPSQPRRRDGLTVNTLWGELAWQIGGAEGYSLVEASDRDGTSPGKEVLAALFQRFAPCIVLLDETVAYLRQFETGRHYAGGSFDSNLSFIQALTEAASAVPTAMVLASLPESMMEVGDVQGQRALEVLQKYFGRIEAVWRPVATEEAFEIVRRRLFRKVTDANARDAVCRAFADYYLKHPDQFPAETRESGYYRRLQEAYPIHPEVFERLYQDWSTLPKFQRTRGVLRLMARLIHTLWREDNRDYLILPGSILLADLNVRTELTKYLEGGWDPIIERDIDGPRSLPRQLDDATPTLGGLQACRRAARSIFLGSAPSVSAQRVRGIGIERIRLGCAQPGQSLGHYGDAMRRLTDQLHYLYSGNDRYWYDTRPNLRREMEDRMQRFTADSAIYPELQGRLERMIAKGIFTGVHVFRDHGDVPDDYGLRLVVLPPASAHRRKAQDSAAGEQVLQYLAKRGEQPRQHKNRLIFLAPDRDALTTLKDHIRRYLAWTSIVNDTEQLNLDVHHAKEAKNSRAEAEERVKGSLRETYRWILVPIQEAKPRGGLTDIGCEEVAIPTSATYLSEAIERALVENELIIKAWAPIHLATMLKRWFWKEDKTEVNALAVWQAIGDYPYLPKLVDSQVFQNTIAEGIKHRDFFAYASGKEGDRYLGLLFGTTGAIYLDQSGFLVRPEAAEGFLRQEAATANSVSLIYPDTHTNHVLPMENLGINDHGQLDRPANTPPVSLPAAMRRFHALVNVDPVRGGLQFSDIMNEVVQHFTAKLGTRVRISVDIEAELVDGFDEALQRTVRENCRTLRFQNAEFERE